MSTLGLLIIGLCGCGANPARQNPGAVPDAAAFQPMQLKTRMILVTVPTRANWQTQDVEAVAESLANDHGIGLMAFFPLNSIGVQCIGYNVPPERSLDDVVSELRADSRVDSAQGNQVFEGLALPSDPYAALQYGANAIGALDAHRVSTGKGVKVGLIDTGVDFTHPDLQGRIVETNNFVQKGVESFEQDAHGTAVAGVIAAVADNQVGIFGVAPDSEVIAVKACDYVEPGSAKARCSTWSLAQAIDFATLAGAQVLNLSLVGPPDALVGRLIRKADERNVTVVAAASPAADGPGFPASMETVIPVLASDVDGAVEVPAWEGAARTLFAAPGADIVTTAPNADYHFLSGSSLSAAHVTGVIALLLQHVPTLAPARIKQVLSETTKAATNQDETGADNVGILDVCAALRTVDARAECG